MTYEYYNFGNMSVGYFVRREDKQKLDIRNVCNTVVEDIQPDGSMF